MTVLDRLVRRASVYPPPGPFRAGFWRSPLRGPWFTAVLSVALLPGITLMFLTGLASYAAYNPNLAPGNDTTPDKGLLGSWLPAAMAGVAPIDDTWRLELNGAPSQSQGMALSRAQLLELPQHTARLPIACVEGWSTGVQTWTGVRLAELAALVGAAPGAQLLVESLRRGGFGSATLSAGQVLATDALLALQVNGADLTLDHGFPARIVVPAIPGVHATKWVTRMTFLVA